MATPRRTANASPSAKAPMNNIKMVNAFAYLDAREMDRINARSLALVNIRYWEITINAYARAAINLIIREFASLKLRNA